MPFEDIVEQRQLVISFTYFSLAYVHTWKENSFPDPCSKKCNYISIQEFLTMET